MDNAQVVHSIRHFNRYYTNRLGLLSRYRFDTRFTLTEARVVLEIGRHGELTQSALRTNFTIDTGYLSRVVARLIEAATSPRERTTRTVVSWFCG